MMDAYMPQRAVLFFYECIRLLALLIMVFLASPESAGGGAFFPYAAYFSPNVLFLLAALFVWLRPEVYRNFLSLYIAGKTLSVVLFFLWILMSSRQFSLDENIARSYILLMGSVLLSLADVLSILGARFLSNKYRESSGGV